MKQGKKVRTRLLLLGGMICISVGSTVAYAAYKNHEQKINDFQVANLSVEIDEAFTPSTSFSPDTGIKKEVRIFNNNEEAVFVRVLVLPTIIKDFHGEKMLMPADFKGNTPQITIDFDTTDWVDGEDGYFYYLKEIRSGKKSSELLKKVTVNSNNFKEEYTDVTVNIELKVEAISTTENAYRHAWWNGSLPNSGDARKPVDDALQAL